MKLLRRSSAPAAGKAAEDRACKHLRAGGLKLLTRNYRCRGGEIDLVMRDGPEIVFVEVRFRGGGRFGSAAETIDRRKRLRVIGAARHYLQSHPDSRNRPCRFDVVAIDGAGGAADLDWIRDAFQAEY